MSDKARPAKDAPQKPVDAAPGSLDAAEVEAAIDANDAHEGGRYLDVDGKTFVDANGEPLKGKGNA